MSDTTTRYQILEPAADRSDAADIPLYIRATNAAVERSVMFGQGADAARPAFGIQGRIYVATDLAPKIVYYDTGAAWFSVGSVPDASISTAKIIDGAVTLAKLDSAVPIVPIGAVIEFPWASGSIPSWTAMPVNQTLLRATYSDLNALASASGYCNGSGNGTTTFGIGDWRSRVAIGMDNMGGSAAGRITTAISGANGTTLGGTIGSEGVVLTSGQIPSHNHGTSESPHGHNNPAGTGDNPGTAGILAMTSHAFFTDVATDVATTGLTINNAGGGGAHTSVQPGIFVNKIMRVL